MVHLTKTPSMSSMMNKKKSSSHNKQKNTNTTTSPTMTSPTKHQSTKEKTTNNNNGSSSRSTPNKNKQKTPSSTSDDIHSVSSKSASFLKEVTASLESMLGTRSPSTGTNVQQRSRINEDRESINDDDTTNSCGFEVAMAAAGDNDDDCGSSNGEIIHEVIETDATPCGKGVNECNIVSLPDGSVVVTEQDIDQLVEEEHRWEQQHSQSFSQRSLVAGASQQIPAPPPLPPPGATPHGVKSLYGQPKSVEEVTKIMGALPPSPVVDSKSGAAAAEGGDPSEINSLDRRLKYHARLIPDDRHVQDRLIRRSAIDPKSIFTYGGDNTKRREIKPRRGPLPAVFVSDFMKSLVVIESPTSGGSTTKKRWIFSGVLNGWPGLQTLEVISITCRTADKVSNMFDNDKTNLLRKQMMRHRLVRLWHTDKEGLQNIPPHIHSDILTGTKASGATVRELRVTLRAPEYTIEGYTFNNPGYVFWYEAARSLKNGGRVLCGQSIVETMKTEQGDGNAQCTKLHLMSHRYATGALRREMPKDRLTYHSIVVLEWDHQQYVSVIESAYLHGLSGYAGKSNWYHDKLEPMTNLYKSFHPLMICPWESSRMEIRCNDLPHCKTLKEFQQYVKQYTGTDKRFLDPHYTASSSCRLTFSTKQHIAQYLCNYIRRNPNYSEINRNCQTFAADFYGFMAGKKNIQPFHPINRVDYQNRSHTFLYNPDMFQ